MQRRLFPRCGHAPGALSSVDRAVVDAFRAMLAARNSQPAEADSTSRQHRPDLFAALLGLARTGSKLGDYWVSAAKTVSASKV